MRKEIIEKSSEKKSLFEKILLLFIEGGVYLALFAPLVIDKSFFFPFVSPKTLFFRIIVDAIFIAYVLLTLFNRRYLPKLNILTIGIALYIAAQVAAALFGINFERSFWSVFERMTGLITFFHLFAFYIILTSCFRERKYWERILAVAIFVGVSLSLYIRFSDTLSTRGGGTVGNVSFMAGYLLFDIFFAVMLFFFKKSLFWKIPLGLALILMLSVLFFNQELPRGAVGALFGGSVLLILGYLVFSKSKKLMIAAPVFLAFIALVLILISQTSFFKTKITDLVDLPGESRRIVWSLGFESWKEKPWLGWGPENFNVAFAKYFNPRMFLTSDVWYDRVHNVVLDVLNESGIIGLLSYLAIYAIAIFMLLKAALRVSERKNVFLPLGMAVVLLVYFFQNLWVFDMISTYLMFFLSLAFIAFLISNGKENAAASSASFAKSPVVNFLSPILGAFFIILAIVSLYFGNIQSVRASKLIIKGIISPVKEANSYFAKALDAAPMAKFEASEQFSRKVADLVYDTGQDRKAMDEGMEASALSLEKSINNGLLDFRLHLVLGRHYTNLFILNSKTENLDLAVKWLNKAIELSPKNQQGYWSLAQAKLFQGKHQEGIDILQKAVDVEPEYARSWWFLAMGYKAFGENKKALENLEMAMERGYRAGESAFYPDDYEKIIELYQDLGMYKEAVDVYKEVLQKDPSKANLWAGLAVASANLGKFDEARIYAAEAMRLNSSFTSQLEEFLKSLPKEGS